MKASKILQRVYYPLMSLSMKIKSLKSNHQKARASKTIPSKVRSARISLKKKLIRVQDLNKSKDLLTLNWFSMDRNMRNRNLLTRKTSFMVGLLHSEQSQNRKVVSRKALFQIWLFKLAQEKWA